MLGPRRAFSGFSSLTATAVASLNIICGGSGYSAAPGVVLGGGGGSGAAATATISPVSQTIAWDSENRPTWVQTSSSTTFTDPFDTLDSNAWAFSGHQAINTGTLKNTGTGTDYNANFYRSSFNINGGTSGQGIQVEFKVDQTNTSSHFMLEADGSPYRRFGLIADSNTLFVQYCADGVNWVYPATLINPVLLNTWYVMTLKVTPSGAGIIQVWQKDNPAQRGAFALQMPAGLNYHFHHWIYRGNAWLDNYQEMNLGASTFVYDGDGNRIKKTENGLATVYVKKYYEKNTATGEVTTYYYEGSRLIAKRTGVSSSFTLQYIHQDHLTGTSVVSSSAGGLVSSIAYLPYGQARSGDVPTDKKFTGQILDSTGLYYYGARFYDPAIGRFISPDTVVPNPAIPQSLNRYSYCLNNPLKFVDPTGNDYWVTNEGQNDAEEFWYCVYSDSDYSDLLGIVTGGSELESRFGGSVLHIKNDESAIQSQVGTPAYKMAFDKAHDTGYSTYYMFYGGFDCGISLDDSGIKPATGIWSTLPTLTFAAAVPLGLEFGSEFGGGGGGFSSFGQLKKSLGSPGEGNVWHHVVEQSQIQKSGFEPTQVHNPSDVLAVDAEVNRKIAAYYNSMDPMVSKDMRVRNALAGRSFEEQFEFGIDVLRRFGIK